MRISTESLYSAVDSGYCTGLVCTYLLEISTKPYTLKVIEHPPETYVELPDEWFERRQWAEGRRCSGKEKGHHYWSRIGWEANKEEIRKRFNSKENLGHTWEECVAQIEKELERSEKATLKYKKYLQSKIDGL